MSAMAVDEKFFDLMESAHSQHQTGKLYAYARGNGVVHVATLLFKEGTLCGCKFDTQSGIEALKSIAGAMLASVMFIRTNPAQIADQGSMPEYGDVVRVLRGGITGSAQVSTQEKVGEDLTGGELVYATAVTLGDILGDKAMRKVEELGQLYPPDADKQKFVSACMEYVSAFMGAKRAAEIIDEIF